MKPKIKLVPKKYAQTLFALKIGLELYYANKSWREDWRNKTSVEYSALKEIAMATESAIKEGRVFGYFLGQELVGYIEYKFLNKDHHSFPNSIFISELFVDPIARLKGIGKALVMHVLTIDFPCKYKYFSVTHCPEEKFLTEYYQKLGFIYDRVLTSGNIALIKNRR